MDTDSKKGQVLSDAMNTLNAKSDKKTDFEEEKIEKHLTALSKHVKEDREDENEGVEIDKILAQHTSQSKEVIVGKEHQAAIPAMNMSPSKHKRPKAMAWNPELMEKNELNGYLEELKRVLKNDRINQERALQLLTDKGYNKEEALSDVKKNGEFYNEYLITDDDV